MVFMAKVTFFHLQDKDVGSRCWRHLPLREGTHEGETGGWSRRVLQPGALGSMLTMLTSWINACTWCWEEFVSTGPFRVV